MSLAERFWPKVMKTETCWLWLGFTDGHGYGQISIRTNTPTEAHRVAFFLTHGYWAKELDHLCRIRHCVRPDHLEEVNRSQNMRRSQGSDDFCKRGHPRTPENEYISPNGWTVCKLCRQVLWKEKEYVPST